MPRLPVQGIVSGRTPVYPFIGESGDDTWSEFKDKLSQIHARITDNYIDGSDPVLHVRSSDGRNWTIELANRSRNEAVGLTAAAAMPGDRISVTGRRTRHFGEYRIKALRLTIGNRTYDLYPDAIA